MQVKELRGNILVPISVPYVPAAGAGGGSWVAPTNFLIVSATIVWGAAITGAATNNFLISFFNRGAAGAGTVQWGTAITYASGVNATKANPNVVTLSSTAADLLVAAGDVISAEITSNGTGLICPGGTVQLTGRWR